MYPYSQRVQCLNDGVLGVVWSTDSFANQVIEVETWLPAPVLLETLLAIESEMGRVREVHWGPRLIDLDLLFVEDQVLYTDDLILPHPYIAERLFVLESLQEIAPHLSIRH